MNKQEIISEHMAEIGRKGGQAMIKNGKYTYEKRKEAWKKRKAKQLDKKAVIILK